MKRLFAGLAFALMPVLCMAQPFASSVAPDAGKMRVYLFRPAFNDQAFTKEAPVLKINGKAAGRFAQGSFTEIQLDAGHHEFSVDPGPSESPLWRTSFPVKAVEGKTVYLGFWVAQRLNKRVSRLTAALVGPLVAYALDGGTEPAALRLDPMDQEDAEPMLRECVRVQDLERENPGGMEGKQ